MGKIVHLGLNRRFTKQPRPKTFTSNEELIEQVQSILFSSDVSIKALAVECKLHESTIRRLANGYTKWPKPTTLIPLLDRLGYGLTIVKKD